MKRRGDFEDKGSTKNRRRGLRLAVLRGPNDSEEVPLVHQKGERGDFASASRAARRSRREEKKRVAETFAANYKKEDDIQDLKSQTITGMSTNKEQFAKALSDNPRRPLSPMHPLLGFDRELDYKTGVSVSDVYKSMRDSERLRFAPFDSSAKYLKYRETLVSNMKHFSDRIHLAKCTLFTGVKYLDRFLGSPESQRAQIPRTWYQTVALVALMIAAKFEEGDGPVPHFMERFRDLNQRQQNSLPKVRTLELYVVKKFQWDLQEHTVYHFVEYFFAKGIVFEDDDYTEIRRKLDNVRNARKDYGKNKGKRFSKTLSDQAWLHTSHQHRRSVLKTMRSYLDFHVNCNMLEEVFLRWLPSVNAIAIVMAVRKQLGFSPWRKELELLSGHQHNEVYECVCQVWTSFRRRNPTSVKHFNGAVTPCAEDGEEDSTPRGVVDIAEVENKNPELSRTKRFEQDKENKEPSAMTRNKGIREQQQRRARSLRPRPPTRKSRGALLVQLSKSKR